MQNYHENVMTADQGVSLAVVLPTLPFPLTDMGTSDLRVPAAASHHGRLARSTQSHHPREVSGIGRRWWLQQGALLVGGRCVLIEPSLTPAARQLVNYLLETCAMIDKQSGSQSMSSHDGKKSSSSASASTMARQSTQPVGPRYRGSLD